MKRHTRSIEMGQEPLRNIHANPLDEIHSEKIRSDLLNDGISTVVHSPRTIRTSSPRGSPRQLLLQMMELERIFVLTISQT